MASTALLANRVQWSLIHQNCSIRPINIEETLNVDVSSNSPKYPKAAAGDFRNHGNDNYSRSSQTSEKGTSSITYPSSAGVTTKKFHIKSIMCILYHVTGISFILGFLLVCSLYPGKFSITYLSITIIYPNSNF